MLLVECGPFREQKPIECTLIDCGPLGNRNPSNANPSNKAFLANAEIDSGERKQLALGSRFKNNEAGTALTRERTLKSGEKCGYSDLFYIINR